jgi:hypothetical protein
MFKKITRRMIFSLLLVFFLSVGFAWVLSSVAMASVKINPIEDVRLVADPTVVTIIPDAGQNKFYGDADPVFTFTNDGDLDAEDFTGTLGHDSGENVGNYEFLIGTLDAGPDFTLILSGSRTFAILERDVTITADVASKTYGNSDPVLTYQVTSGSLVSGDAFSGSLTRVSGENVGSYAIQQDTLALTTNYDLTFIPNDFTIIPKTASVTPSATSKTYGNSDPIFTGTLSGFLTGDNVTASYSRTPGENVDGSPYVISGTLSPSGVLGNYIITYNTANFTITTRPITVSADPKSKTYGNSDPVLTYQVTSGSLVSGDAFSGSLTRVSGENVGSYAINRGTLALSGNYNLTYNGANLVINKATPAFSNLRSPTINFGTASVDLGGNLKLGSLIPTGNLRITVAGETHGTTAPITPDASGDFSHSILTSNLALGIYPITYSYLGDGNFNTISDITKTLTVNNSNAMITLLNLSQTYDGQPKPVSYSTTPPGLIASITYNSSATAPTNAGSYDVAASITSAGYSGSSNGTLTIAKATPIVTWTNPGDITYGTALSNVQLNATTSIPGSFIYSPASDTMLNAGSDQTLNATFTPTNTGNYNTASKSVIINVNKATPIFTNLSSPAINQGTASIVLGGNIKSVYLVPTGSVSITLNGVTLPASINAATGDFSSTFDTSALVSSASPYPIAFSYNGDTNFNSISDNASNLTVTPVGTPSPTPTPTTPPSNGGGGGGGGAGGSILASGFSNNTRLEINSSGLILSAAKLTTIDGKATLDIPYRTKLLSELGNPLSILSVVDTISPPQPPYSNTLMLSFTFGPDGAKFDPPINLTLSYDPDALPQGIHEDALFIAYWDGSRWISLESRVDPATHTVSAPISHFSTYSLLGEFETSAPTPIPEPAPGSASNSEVIPSPTMIPEILQRPTAATSTITNIPEQTLTPDEPSPLAPTQTPPFSILIIIYVVVFIAVAFLTVLFVSRLRGRA